MSDYNFDPRDLKINRIYRPNNYRSVVTSFLTELNELLGTLAECLNSDMFTDALNTLENLQKKAINLGEYTESIKGEGYDIVKKVEQLCEDIYEMYAPLAEYINNTDEELDTAGIELTYSNMDRTFADLVNLYDTREEVLFLSLKPEYFKDYRSLYDEAVADINKDVYVVPIPWYKKDFEGNKKAVCFFPEGFPEDVEVYDCQKYDIDVHEPETIVIQFPSDEYGDRVGIPSVYYSRNLRKNTNRLILIPFEEPDEFDESDYRPYYNMKFYATQPAVICADEVWLYDEKLKGLYVKKLTEFAGADTERIWKEKIRVVERPKEEFLLLPDSEIRRVWERFKCGLGDKWLNPEGKSKKVILFQPVFSSFVAYGEHILEKLQRNLKIFAEHADSIVVIWLEQEPLKKDLIKIEKNVANDYRKMVEEFTANGGGVFISDDAFDNGYNFGEFLSYLESEEIRKGASLERIAIEISDAYYGDGDYVARQFALEKKPVMIQNVEI